MSFCILSNLYFVFLSYVIFVFCLFVYCHICVLSFCVLSYLLIVFLYFVTFVFCLFGFCRICLLSFCILSYLYSVFLFFVTFAFCLFVFCRFSSVVFWPSCKMTDYRDIKIEVFLHCESIFEDSRPPQPRLLAKNAKNVYFWAKFGSPVISESKQTQIESD